MLRDNLIEVQNRIHDACLRSGRDPKEVTLIAVSKTKPVSMIREIMDEGVIDFGENRPQELKEKHDHLPGDLNWHMIGHLQTNKVKYVVGRACLIHSVDSLKLAGEINREAEKQGIIVPILIEVNVAAEETKFGAALDETIDLVKEISLLPHLQIKGLMTIAPFTDDPEENRVYFRNLKKLFIDINEKRVDNVCMSILSMGMTGDFEVAIEEGATMVRVGTGIFGEREYGTV